MEQVIKCSMPHILLLSLLQLLTTTVTGFLTIRPVHLDPFSLAAAASSSTSSQDESSSLTHKASSPQPFQIRSAERQDVEFISKLITKELSESGFNKERDIPFWKMPAFLVEESAARIQIYERLEHW